MPAHATRMLLLGAVALFEPVNGYQIRRELMSWQVDRWANVNPGSIYGGLATLTRQEHLVRHELTDGGRDVSVFEITESGRAELDRLVADALEQVEYYDRSAFMAAFSMLTVLDPERAAASLEVRQQGLADMRAEVEAVRQSGDAVPPHVGRGAELWFEMTTAELAWLRGVLADLKTGKLPGTDPDWGWLPPPDDPGWQMGADRMRYLALLGRDR